MDSAEVTDKPALVLFDFDGVVVDSEVISLSELQVTMAEYGVNLTVEEVRRKFLGSSIKQLEAFIQSQGFDTEGFSERWHRGLFKRFQSELTVCTGIPELLDALDAEHITFCIASGGSFERLRVALRKVDLTERFEGRVFSADLVDHGKPAPDLFLLAAEKCGVSPEACLVIEDSPAGISAATAAKMQSIGFVGGLHLAEAQSEHEQLLRAKGATDVLDELDWYQIISLWQK